MNELEFSDELARQTGSNLKTHDNGSQTESTGTPDVERAADRGREFTAGPWGLSDGNVIWAGDPLSDGTKVAQTLYLGPKRYQEECLNGYLIAAAPLLYDLFHAVYDSHRESDKWHTAMNRVCDHFGLPPLHEKAKADHLERKAKRGEVA